MFGLHTARLDLRQYSEYHDEVLGELFARLGRHDDYVAMDGAARTEFLSEQLQAPLPDLQQLEDLSEQALELLDLLHTAARGVAIYGPNIFGPYLISMTRGSADVLAVLEEAARRMLRN